VSRIDAVVPVKPLGRALGRLAPWLAAPARRELQAAMVGDVLGALARARGVGRTWVMSGDPTVRGLGLELGAEPLDDLEPPAGINAAVARGLDAAARDGADAALVVMGDLPLAAPGEVERLIAAAPAGTGAALVSSRDGTGTNALLLRGPHALEPAFGEGSLARHLAQARERALPLVRVESPALALDIDTMEDLEALALTHVECESRLVLARLGVLEPALPGRSR